MLYIYNTKKNFNTKYIIWDVERPFNGLYDLFIQNDYCKKVIKCIDNGELLDNNAVSTPFGLATPSKLSTGSKALILALYSGKEVLVNFREVGDNVVYLALLFSDTYDLSIYLDRFVDVPDCERYNVMFNNKTVNYDRLRDEI